jgi:hypothetical protein
MRRAACLAAGCASLCLWAVPARAGDVHTYTDVQGVVHLYNVHSHKRAAAVPRQDDLQIPMMLIDAEVARMADFYKLPAALIKAVIATESNFNPSAVSVKGAIGLMQLMPETAREMFVEDPYDWIQNIEGGSRYLRVLLNQFGDGDLNKVLAAYNAGPEAVLRTSGALGIPPIQETQEYVLKVRRNYQAFKAQSPSS